MKRSTAYVKSSHRNRKSLDCSRMSQLSHFFSLLSPVGPQTDSPSELSVFPWVLFANLEAIWKRLQLLKKEKLTWKQRKTATKWSTSPRLPRQYPITGNPSTAASQCTVVQNSYESRRKYWVTCSSVHSFARAAHSFAYTALLTSLRCAR